MKLIISIIAASLTLYSCTTNQNSYRFDRDVWVSNNDISDQHNPRSRMTKDLIENYLKRGMHRDTILILLGQPYLEKIEYRIPKELEIPDSLSKIDSIGVEEFNKWHRTFSQPDTIMRYPVGWSTIDPNFLIIKLGKDSVVIDFWEEQG